MPNSEDRDVRQYHSEIEALLAWARQLEEAGSIMDAVRMCRVALALLPRRDPRRGELVSNIDRLMLKRDEAADSFQSGSIGPSEVDLPGWVSALFGCMALVILGLVLLSAFWFFQSYLGPPQLQALAPSAGPTATPFDPTLSPRVPLPLAPVPTIAPVPTSAAATPMPAPTPAKPSNFFPPPTLVPVRPSPTATLASSHASATGRVLFMDDFSSGLDPAKWERENLAGTGIEVSHGVLQLSSSVSHFPYIYTRTNPFPATGDLRVTIRFRYPRSGVCGAPIAMASFFLPSGLSQDETNRLAIAAEANGVSIWLWRESANYRSGPQRPDFRLSSPNTNWTAATIEYVRSRYTLSINGVRFFESNPTGARPQILWVGQPIELGAGVECPWDTIEVNLVRVEAIP
jgi:hypothetical protein